MSRPEKLTDFGRLGVMETHVTDATALATALSMMSDSMDSEDGMAVSTIAVILRQNLRAIDELHAELWRNLHPDREKFEREGWPGDRASAA